jgi:hypothetical protein
MPAPTLIQDADSGLWWRFDAPLAVLAATRLEDVVPVLRKVEARVEADGLWAAGYIAYEAGPAFYPALRARPAGPLPLIHFGLHRAPRLEPLPPPGAATRPRYRWTSSVARNDYDAAIARIRRLIEEGEAYQVNYTVRLRAPIEEPPWELFLRAVDANAPRHGAYLDCGRFVICSASPEMFLRLDGEDLTSRPMKGTAGRGLWLAHDEERARALAASPKDRAENVMIVDMVRNDLGRVCATGSVRAPELFTVERYPTVWQMTSTVRGRTSAAVTDVLGALFPPASITGTPRRAQRRSSPGSRLRRAASIPVASVSSRRAAARASTLRFAPRASTLRSACSSTGWAAASSGIRRATPSTRNACSRRASSPTQRRRLRCWRRCCGSRAKATSCSRRISRGWRSLPAISACLQTLAPCGRGSPISRRASGRAPSACA